MLAGGCNVDDIDGRIGGERLGGRMDARFELGGELPCRLLPGIEGRDQPHPRIGDEGGQHQRERLAEPDDTHAERSRVRLGMDTGHGSSYRCRKR